MGVNGTYLHPEPDTGRPLIIAHRGGKWTGVKENSQEAIAMAVESGITHIEVDVRTTLRGEPVLAHDLIGSRVGLYTLIEALTDFPTTYFRLDLKDLRSCRTATDIVRKLDCQDRVYISSFWDYRINRAARRLPPPVPRALGCRRGITSASFMFLSRNKPFSGVPGKRVFHPHIRLARKPFAGRMFKRIQDQGLYIHVWTVNEPEDVQLCLDLNVDGILTDRPQLVKLIVDRERYENCSEGNLS